MYKKFGLTLLFMVVFLFGVISVFAQEKEVEIAEEVIEPITPPRLFVAPTANVIRSLDVSLVGGGSYGAGEVEASAPSFLGTFAFGLADIAQIEIGTMGVTGALKAGTIPKPSPGFKMKILPEGKYWPGVAASVRVSMWTDEDKDTSKGKVTYSTRTSDFYVVASKTIKLPSEEVRSISVHGGLDVVDARLKSSIMEEAKKTTPTVKDATKSIPAPFGGLEIWVTEKGKAMIEVGFAPSFEFDITAKGEKFLRDDVEITDTDDVGIQEAEEDITGVLVGTLGVRFFITRHLAADVGVTYRRDFKGVSDTLIGAKLEISIPTRLAYEAITR
jgi:hypothetical protein